MSLGVDRVCVIIARTRHKMVQIELDEAVNRGAKFIELRLDFFAKAIDFKRLLPHKKCPWIATLRRHVDGGQFKGTEAERQTMLRQAIVSDFDWVDVETDIADDVKRFRNVKRIVSYHNLTETPDELEGIYERINDQDADVLKIVTMAQHPRDCMRVLNLIKNAKKPTVGHCVGEIGLPSRILSLRYVVPFLYAAFNKERGIAPGLPSLEEVRGYFRVHHINADTKVYGVLGDPVSQSFSPARHNLMFRQIGMNAVYLPFRVPGGELADSLQAYEAVPVCGYSVTIPHKEASASIAVMSDDRVRQTVAANTLVRHPDGFHAFNTDYEAALAGLDAICRSRKASKNRSKTVPRWCWEREESLGRFPMHSIEPEQARFLWLDECDKTEKLANEVHGKAVEWAARHNIDATIVVNCTPIGMHPNLDETPLHGGFLRPGMLVFDTVYNPEQTLLLKEAKARGCAVLSGVDMFVRQSGSGSGRWP